MKYIHSKNFVYCDLKPDNVLVWKYPKPDTQWSASADASVWVKIADYGISKQVSPQGLYGMEGTLPYMPPEIILHGGQETYSTKMDIYAFGMFIYYLISFRSPFEDLDEPITAILREGNRPSLINVSCM